MRHHAPLDPECPTNPNNRPYANAEQRHRAKCKRCQKYGAANIEVV